MAANSVNPDKWVDLYSDYLYNYAYSRVNSRETALDLVQDTFIAALKGMEKFEGRSTEKTWLVSILKRKTIDHYRKAYRNKETSLNEAITSNNPFEDSGDLKGNWKQDRTPASWGNDAEKRLENEEFNGVLQECIERLPDKHAAVFTLQVMEEMKSDEVCKELEITSSNLWVILHRARTQLRECIEKNWIIN